MNFAYKLRLIDVLRKGKTTKEFVLAEHEQIIDVKWFNGFVSVTVAEVTYREDDE